MLVPVYGGPRDGGSKNVPDPERVKTFVIITDDQIHHYRLEIHEINGRMEYLYKYRESTLRTK